MFSRLLITGALASASLMAQAGDLVVIVHPSAPALNHEQVTDIFLGRTPRSLPVDQADGLLIRTEFYEKATGRDLAQVKAIWSRVIFTGKGLAPKEYANSAAVKKAVAANPRMVGYIEKSAVDGSVKVAFELD